MEVSSRQFPLSLLLFRGFEKFRRTHLGSQARRRRGRKRGKRGRRRGRRRRRERGRRRRRERARRWRWRRRDAPDVDSRRRLLPSACFADAALRKQFRSFRRLSNGRLDQKADAQNDFIRLFLFLFLYLFLFPIAGADEEIRVAPVEQTPNHRLP